MKQYLLETWQLFYWALYFPSKLQQRMNQWAPRKDQEEKLLNTEFSDIILFNFNLRFANQFILLLLISSLPLIINIAIKGQQLDWLQLPIVILTSYSIAVLFLPISLFIPLIWWLTYLKPPDERLKDLIEAVDQLPLPNLSELAIGIGIGIFFLVIIILLVFQLLKRDDIFLARIILVTGGSISVVIISLLTTHNISFMLTISGFTGFLLLLASYQLKLTDDAVGVALGVVVGIAGVIVLVVGGIVLGVVALVLSGGVAGFVTLVVAGIITGIVAGGVVGGEVGGVAGGVAVGVAVGVAGLVAVANSSMPMFLVSSGLVAYSLSYDREKIVGLYTAALLTVLAFENLGLSSLIVIPVVLATYYRFFPDYLFFTPISLLPSFPLLKRLNSIQLLYLLPPHSSEIYWFPLPNHDRILASAFRRDPPTAWLTFQQMQTFPLPGFQETIKHALPKIIADQLAIVKTTPELLQRIKPDTSNPFLKEEEKPENFIPHFPRREGGLGGLGLLPLLLPTFYQSETDPTTSPYITPELSILFPRFQDIAQDVAAALESKNIALRERGLERILNNLVLLQLQLPGLGLNPQARQRWEPVILQWQKVIKKELKTQQQQSQGELLNPFQYGNPLTLNRDRLFKGREKFADDIVRLILDRNRPTLVLHAPRRCGKTSFLYNLPRLLPSDLIPIYLDMQSAAVTTDEAGFCQGLVRAIYKDSQSQGVKLPPPPQRQDFLKTPYITLEEWLEQALKKLGDRRLLLNLDEFEKIGAAIEQGRMTKQLFDELRHLIQHYEQLCFLFSGVQTLEELGPNWSSYFISVVPIKMLYLEPHEAEELLINPDPEFQLRYDSGIVAEVLRLTRCHPYLVQLLGAAMVDQANYNHVKIVTPDILEAALKDAFTKGEPYFTNIWDEFSGTTPEEKTKGQEFLLKLAQGETLTIDDKILQRLLRYHIIETTENSYKIEVPLIEMWLKKRTLNS